MNGWHDLGGMHGFGPILPNCNCDEPVFQDRWEARVFALTVAIEYLDKWNLDESRYAIEDQHPVDYLKNSYYENWLISLERLMVEKDLITNNELASGAMDVNATRNEFVPLHVSEVKRYIYEGGTTRMDIKSSPQFEIGDMVSAANVNSLGHTRLPRYVRESEVSFMNIMVLMCFPIRMLWALGSDNTFTVFISRRQRFGAM